MKVFAGFFSGFFHSHVPSSRLITMGLTGLPGFTGRGRLSPYEGSNGLEDWGAFGSRSGGYFLR